jgi:hypothetical protein
MIIPLPSFHCDSTIQFSTFFTPFAPRPIPIPAKGGPSFIHIIHTIFAFHFPNLLFHSFFHSFIHFYNFLAPNFCVHFRPHNLANHQKSFPKNIPPYSFSIQNNHFVCPVRKHWPKQYLALPQPSPIFVGSFCVWPPQQNWGNGIGWRWGSIVCIPSAPFGCFFPLKNIFGQSLGHRLNTMPFPPQYPLLRPIQSANSALPIPKYFARPIEQRQWRWRLLSAIGDVHLWKFGREMNVGKGHQTKHTFANQLGMEENGNWPSHTTCSQKQQLKLDIPSILWCGPNLPFTPFSQPLVVFDPREINPFCLVAST